MVRGSLHLGSYTSSGSRMMEAMVRLYEQIVDSDRSIRRINISADFVVPEDQIPHQTDGVQLSLFADYEELTRQRQESEAEQIREKKLQTALLSLQKKYHKNAVFRGMDLLEDATTLERNRQIGGHRS